MKIIKCFLLIIFMILAVFNLQARASEFDLICGNNDSETVLLLNRTPMNEFKGILVFGRDERPVHLRKAIFSRGIAKFRDLDPKSEYKVDFDYDLQRNSGSIELKTQFNQVVLKENLDCQN